MSTSSQTLTTQRPGWRALEQLVADNPWLPAAYITLSCYGSAAVQVQCQSAADFEAWREALAVTPDEVTSREIRPDTISLDAAAVVAGVRVEAYVHIPLPAQYDAARKQVAA